MSEEDGKQIVDWQPASNLLPPSLLIVSLPAFRYVFAVFDYGLLTLLLLLFVLSSWMGTPCSWVCQNQALTSPQPIRCVFMRLCVCVHLCVETECAL